jgi:nuclear-control-of-ATPase protein 2
MTLVMDIIEKEIKAPVRNLLAGEVMRALLIQMQKLKADMEEEMLAVDKYGAIRWIHDAI